jgi:hypothetical protein
MADKEGLIDRRTVPVAAEAAGAAELADALLLPAAALLLVAPRLQPTRARPVIATNAN